jgi:TP901 family phage tail tape measure protein
MAGKGKFSLAAIFAAKDKLSAPLAKIQTKLAVFGKTASKVLKGANKAADVGMRGVERMSTAIGVAGVASVAGLGFELRKTIEEGVEFERTLTFAAAQFPGMIKAGTAEFEALKNAAKQVGDETEFSAQQAAEGLTLLATAGLDAEAAVAALPKVVNFAMASQVEFARASDIANDSMGAFGLTSKNAAKNAANMSMVMDVLTRAAADSTTNVEQLFEAVSVGGPIAKTAGASIQEFVAMAGVLAKVGLKGAEAGTAIRNAFLELGAPSSAATKGLKKLGVQVAKTKDGAIDMTTTIGRFAIASKKMTKAQKITALGAVFGARTVGPFIALMDAGVDVIDEMEKSLLNAKGTTEGMATVMQQDALGALRQFDSLVSGVRLDVFDAIREPLLDIVKATGAWVTENRALIKTKANEWAVALKDNLPEIWMWIVRIGKGFAAFAAFAVTVKVANTAILAYEAASKLAAAASWTFSLAIKATKLALNSSTLATIRLRLATLASRSASLVAAAAQAAYTVPLNAATLAMVRGKIAQVALRIATLASRAATVVAGAAQAAYALVVGTSTGALASFRVATLASVPAIGAQVAAMAPLLATFAAAAAAVGALIALYDQLNKLNNELAGSGGIMGTASKMIEMGTFDPFAAHDAAMNEKARADRDARDKAQAEALAKPAPAPEPQIVSPAARAASEAVEAGAGANATVDGRIVVEAQKGTKATVKAKPRTVPLQLEPSGAF